LHEGGSTNSVNEKQGEEIEFASYFVAKDILVFCIFLIVLIYFVFYSSNALGHPDNAIPANPLVTPAHIVPE
jgi:ubiquinol-cytochrome c reductase cytochrome b subunit